MMRFICWLLGHRYYDEQIGNCIFRFCERCNGTGQCVAEIEVKKDWSRSGDEAEQNLHRFLKALRDERSAERRHNTTNRRIEKAS